MSTHSVRLYKRQPLLREARQNLRSLVRYRELLRHLVRAALSRESTGTVFGVVWWLLDPLLMGLVFIFFVDVILGGGGMENYALFVLMGVVVWKHFQSGVQNGITSTLVRQQLMKQVAFPKAVIPLSAALAETFHFFIGLGVVIVVAIPFGIYPNPLYVLFPVLIAIQLTLMLGVSFALSALNIFFRDIQNLAAYALRLGFFISPALYAVPRIPDKYRDLYELNPFATLLPAFHSILLQGKVHNADEIAVVAGGSFLVLTGGYLLFVRLERAFTKVD
jgi:lipopolysaccharide transport system permease protein